MVRYCPTERGAAMNKLIFDIGATNTKFALMNEDGEILTREKVPTNYSSLDSYFAFMEQIVAKYRDHADEIAISTNGRMCQDGNTYRAYTMRLLQGVNLKEEMEARTGLPVTVLNDGFCAALGEWWKGAGQGSKNLLVIVLGSGMGAGMILDGKLYQGSRLNAAMLFGMLSAYGGEKTEFAGFTTSFTLLLYQLSAMKQIPLEEMTGHRFFEYVLQSDSAAAALLDGYCESIAGIIYNCALLLDPEGIVVTGGLASQTIIIDTINHKLGEIPQKALQGQAAGLLEMVSADPADFSLRVTQGSLTLDANIYGAFYHTRQTSPVYGTASQDSHSSSYAH